MRDTLPFMKELTEMNEQVAKLETRTVALERLMERVRSKAKTDIERLTRHNKKLARERDEAIARAELAEEQLEGMKIAYNLARAVADENDPPDLYDNRYEKKKRLL